ncbi:hypothetical protein ACH5RR_014727 [Cinchona calisaya]|uniref:Phytocyanin domain-containing protein n=1 Tax=Cinchona calisaya TaxID=153742 RepID=A0ABD2ZRI5_9GENT
MAKMAGGLKVLTTLLALVIFSLDFGGKRVVAEVHHVVGDEKGWSPSTDVVSWFTGRVFRVGDKIWFAYSATDDSIMELQTAEEFHSCNLTNPIRMYTSGLDKVSLDNEGTRYFASGNLDSCKNGLKLPINVNSFPFDSPPPPEIPFPIFHSPPPPEIPFPVFHSPPPPTPTFFTPPPPEIPFPVFPSPPPPTPTFHAPPPPDLPFPVFPPPPPPTPPFHAPPPPPHPKPSASAHFTGLSFTLFVGFVLCYMSM